MKLALLSLAVSTIALAQGAPPPSPPPGGAAGASAASTAGTTPGAGMAVAPIEAAERAIVFDGFTYMDFEWVNPASNAYYVGHNNGFRLASMRLEMQGHPTNRFGFDVSIDAAVDQRSSQTALVGSKIVALQDGYLWFDILPDQLRLKVGQFVVPFGAEALLPDADLPFVRRSIVTGGLEPPEGPLGYPIAGVWGDYCAFSACRDLGISLEYQMSHDKPGLSLDLVLANGNGSDQILNDNNSFLLLARLEAWVESHVTLGLNAFYNPRTVPDQTNQGIFYDERDVAVGADLTARFGGLRLMGMFLWKETTYVTTGAPPARIWGAVGQALYTLPDSLLGIQVGYRYAYYEPNSTIPASELQEHDFLLAYPFPRLPVRLVAQYSHRVEDPSLALFNDGVDVMVQALF